MKKKGVSPLIAAVLLIGFSIVIGTFVTTFILNKVKQTKLDSFEDSPYCENVVLEIVANVVDPSNNPNGLTDLQVVKGSGLKYKVSGLSLKNKGNFKIVGGKITAPGSGTQKFRYSEGTGTCAGPLKPSENCPLGGGIEFDPSQGSVISITPEIIDPEKEVKTFVTCAKNAATFDVKTACCARWKGVKENGQTVTLTGPSGKCPFLKSDYECN